MIPRVVRLPLWNKLSVGKSLVGSFPAIPTVITSAWALVVSAGVAFRHGDPETV